MKIYLAFIVLILSIVGKPVPLFADSWAVPEPQVAFSPSRNFFVLITPVNGIGNGATAEIYQKHKNNTFQLIKKLTLVTSAVPVKFYISDYGYWVTLDNWGKMGYGKVVVFYDFKGQLIKSYRLADLFNEKEISSFIISTSSIHWRHNPAYLNPDQKTLRVSVEGGGAFTFSMKTGSYQFCKNQEKKAICRTKNRNRKWVPLNPNQTNP